MNTLYASYFDLGIMHQIVYNTNQAIRNLDFGRFLELTNPFGADQIKRMAIHNDLLLALLSPFYFLYSYPQTLLIIQSIILALGAVAIFAITQKIFENEVNKNIFALIMAVAYLLYPPMQRANLYEFHAVTLGTTFLLFMFYFWLVRRYWWSFIFFVLAILTKEQVALTTLFFGIYTTLIRPCLAGRQAHESGNKRFSFLVVFFSVIWFILSIFVIIPSFRGERHFALKYYDDFGTTPIEIITGLLKHPYRFFQYLFHQDTFRYFFFLLGPLGFLSLLSPAQLLVALPEFSINLLSNNWNMRNIIYHYTAVIQPFVFIAAIYGAKSLIDSGRFKMKSFLGLAGRLRLPNLVAIFILSSSLLFSYLKGPLPFSREAEIHPFLFPQKEAKEAKFWANILKDEKLKISTTGQLAPFFTSRRYFYIFSKRYQLADYVVIRLNEIYNYPEKNELIPVHERLTKDNRYRLIYERENFEVYKKIEL
jgi:uncharacterized membrane protein